MGHRSDMPSGEPVTASPDRGPEALCARSPSVFVAVGRAVPRVARGAVIVAAAPVGVPMIGMRMGFVRMGGMRVRLGVRPVRMDLVRMGLVVVVMVVVTALAVVVGRLLRLEGAAHRFG